MSIVVLKRKTAAQYKNSTNGSPLGFSLNGTHRNQGYVGQTSLSRSLPRTPFKGSAAVGSGGCCGEYPAYPTVRNPNMACLEDSSVVKRSTLSNGGMLRTKYRWIRRPAPYTTVKPDVTTNSNYQGAYITYIASRAAKACGDEIDESTTAKTVVVEMPIVTRGKPGDQLTRGVSCQIIKPVEGTKVALTASEYLRRLNRKCGATYVNFVVPTSTNRVPYV